MPYKRIVTDQPPTETQMNAWDAQGWDQIQIIGPVLGRQNDDAPGQERVVFVVYMHRHVIEASPRQARALS